MIRFLILYDPNFCIFYRSIFLKCLFLFLKQWFKRDIILEAIYHN